MEIRGVTNRGLETTLEAARNILAKVCPWASAQKRDRALECTARRVQVNPDLWQEAQRMLENERDACNILAKKCPWASAQKRDRALEFTAQCVRVNPGLWQGAQRMLENERSVIAVKPSPAMQARIDQIQERETVRMRLAGDPGNEGLKESLAVLDATIDPLGARLRELPVERPGRSSHERDSSQHDPHRYAEPAHVYREPRPAAPMPAIGDIQLDVGPDYKSVALRQLPFRTVK
eukprot:COSAG02_NODE_14326_length_1284_cov_1.122363_1_plen_234_part_01